MTDEPESVEEMLAQITEDHPGTWPFMTIERAQWTRLRDALRAKDEEIARLTEERQERELALQQLTPGGSEFVNDPAKCVEYLRGVHHQQHEAIKRRHHENARLTEEIARLRGWKAEIEDDRGLGVDHWRMAAERYQDENARLTRQVGEMREFIEWAAEDPDLDLLMPKARDLLARLDSPEGVEG